MKRLRQWFAEFAADLRERRLAKFIADCDAELSRIDDMRLDCNISESFIIKKRAEAINNLGAIQRKEQV